MPVVEEGPDAAADDWFNWEEANDNDIKLLAVAVCPSDCEGMEYPAAPCACAADNEVVGLYDDDGMVVVAVAPWL